MSTKSPRSLPGSGSPRLAGTRREAVVHSKQPLEVTLRLRARSTGLGDFVDQVVAGTAAPLSRHQLAARFGASEDDRTAVTRWAKRNRVTVLDSDLGRRSIDLRAPAERLARLFSVTLVRNHRGDTSWIGPRDGVTLPPELARIVKGVVGFDQRPLASRGGVPMSAVQSGGTRLSFTAPEIARHYRFPEGVDGRGQTIGVIALGGGYLKKDLDTFFHHLELPRPRFTDVSVHGVTNAPEGPLEMADGEVTGDVETVGALAPGAHVVVYFGPNGERGFLETVSRAVHDDQHRPSVLSISWGRNETYWSRRTLRLFDEVLAEAVAMGVTVCCASGDHGALADVHDRVPRVCFPGASAYVVACGGTSLRRRRGAARLEETAWHDAQGASGGGISAIFARPPWQVASGLPRAKKKGGRGVPDVASNADPESGYRVFVHGHWVVGAGTSAAAPLWAGLVALLNQMRGAPLGLFTHRLYGRRQQLVRTGAIRPVRGSERGGEPSTRAWNRHTGLGVPHGAKLAQALKPPVVAGKRRPTRRR